MDFSPWVVLSVVLQFAIVLLSLSVHESAHAWAADRLGDSTGRMLGRITLNPWPHIDMVGTILLPVVLAVAGLPVFGWAKPVPVITRNFARVKRDMALVGIAGPTSNLLLAVVGTAILLGVQGFLGPAAFREALTDPGSAAWWIFQFCTINIFLAVFNMFPLPPLDGSWVLSALLPRVFHPLEERMRSWGPFLLLFLMFTRVLQWVLIPVAAAVQFILVLAPLGLLASLLGR